MGRELIDNGITKTSTKLSILPPWSPCECRMLLMKSTNIRSVCCSVAKRQENADVWHHDDLVPDTPSRSWLDQDDRSEYEIM